MQEQMLTEMNTSSVPDTESIWGSGDWAIDAAELQEWFKDPDGQDFKERVESGEWDKGHANRILEYMKEKRATYGEARDSIGWRGMPRRIIEDVGDAFGETQRLIRDPARIVTDPWEMMMRKVGHQNDREGFMAALENVEGAFSGRLAEVTGSKELAAGALMAWEIPKSFVIGIPTSIWSLITGQGDAGDVLDVATFLLPAVRAAWTGRVMKKTARGAAVVSAVTEQALRTRTQRQVREAVADALKNNTKSVRIPKKLVRDMLKDPEYGPVLQKKFNDLKKASKISRNVELSLEALNLFVQNEELLLELLGYAGQRIILNALTLTEGGMSIEDAIERAVYDFGMEMEQKQGWTPPPEENTTTPPDDQTDPDVEAVEDTPEEPPAPDEQIAPEEVAEEVAEEPAEEVAEEPAEEVAEEVAEEPVGADEMQAVEDAQDPAEDAQEAVEGAEDAQEGETTEEPIEGAQEASEARERLDITQAQEQYGREFPEEQVAGIKEPERISVDVAASAEDGSHLNIYQDFKKVGTAVRSGDRTLYFANDPKRSEKEAQDASKSDSVYQQGDAYYPTFDSLSDMLDYTDAQTESRLGGDLYGTPDRLVRDSARKGQYHVRYELKNIHEVQGSHNVDGSENKAYPPHLQPRDQRGSAVDLEFLDSKARDVAPEILIDHIAQLTDGAPTLSKEYPDASVSGSGRLWILKKMLQDYPEQWKKYRDYLQENARQYGISEADINADPESILIRRIVDDVDEVQLAKDANKFSGLEDTSSEQASADASYLKDNVMIEWKGKRGLSFRESLNHDDNQVFIEKLLQNIPARERTGFLKSGESVISERGAERIRAMMLRYVFRGEYGLKMSQILIESKFDEIQNINNMLDIIVPHLAFLESYIRTGSRDSQYSIAEELARAVGTLNLLKENGDFVADFFKQNLLFEPKTRIGDLNVPTLQMLYIMDHRIGAYQQLASIFMRYVNSVLELDPAHGQLFENEFSKEAFFEKELYDILWGNAPQDLQKQLEAGETSQARDIVQAYVDNLMEQIRKTSNQWTTEPTPSEPEPAPEEAQDTEGVAEETQEAEPEADVEAIEETSEPDLPDIETLAQQYFSDIIKNDFKDKDRLPNKVDFAEQYTLPRNLPPDIADSLVGAQEEVMIEFGARVLQEYDQHVSQLAKSDIKTATPELIYYSPKTKDTHAKRVYAAGKNGDIFITMERIAEGKVDVTFDIPDHEKITVEADIQGRFTDKQARQILDELLVNREDLRFGYGDNPRTHAPALTEKQTRIIEKMPPVVESKKFKDKHFKNSGGIAYAIPGLDPAIRIKVAFIGDNTYSVYVESDMVGSDTGFIVDTIPAENPLDAVQRTLADRFDEGIWDDLNEDPDPVDDPLDSQGVPGNMPTPLSTDFRLKPTRTTGGMLWFRVTDANGNENPDYSITVNPDPLGLNDGIMEVTVRFPNHKKLDAIMEYASGNSPEEAAMVAIANLQHYEIGKGGLGSSASSEPHQATSDTLLESLPPPVKTAERPFGNLHVDVDAMKREGYSKTGKTQIYKFEGDGTPQVTVRKLGTTSDPMWHVEIRYPRYNAVSDISYAKTAKSAIKEVLERYEADDHQWKPLYQAGIYTEMDSVQNAINRRQFATTPAIERRVRGLFTNLRKGVSIDLRGYKITSHKELAVIGQLFRHPGFERFVQFYLDENLQIVGHEVVSFGVPGQTVIPEYTRTNYNMKRLNAKYFVQMHNHPGGPATFSDADKQVAKEYLREYGDKYLGQIVVNSLEYAESTVYQDKHGQRKIRNRDNIKLSETDLGWIPNSSQKKGFFRRNTSIRPGDPLYQYDVNTEVGKLIKKSDTDIDLEDIAKFAKYLQTEKNWTTLFFIGYQNEILAVQDYKDLHLLSPAELWNFIESEARRYGSMYANVFVGEGDWYETVDDLKKSSWNEVVQATGPQHTGIQFAWFDGLKEKEKTLVPPIRRHLLPLYETEASHLMSGRLYETIIDSDYGIDHQLTTPSPARDALIQEALQKIEDHEEFDIYDLYAQHFGIPLESNADVIAKTFLDFIGNRFMISKGVNANVQSPTDAVSTYNELADELHVGTANAYQQSRYAAITDKDRVLTIGDDSGQLATLARISGAASVETINTDGYVRDLFHQIIPDVADAVHNIEADNLSREWTGLRPTVVFLNVTEGYKQKVDEALKILAPNGRLVFVLSESQKESAPPKYDNQYWKTINARYKVYDILVDDGFAYVIDKQKGVSSSAPNLYHKGDIDTIFKKIEEIRHVRPPLTESDVDAEFTGVSPSEQTFTQPISNPYTPKGLGQLAQQESLSLPPTDRGSPGEGQNVARPPVASRPDPGVRVSDAERGGIGATQTDAFSGMSATPATASMGGSGPELGGVGQSSVVGGADVDTAMAGESPVGSMPLQEGQVPGGARGARTRVAGGPTPHETGDMRTPTGIGGYETGRVEQETDLGIPTVRAVMRDADDVPENTPTHADFRTRVNMYTMLVQTGKRTLELMGDTGMSLVSSLKRIRNFGDRLSGRGFGIMDSLFPAWKQFVRDYAKDNNMKLDDASKALNEILVRHHEGKSNTEVPDIVDKIVREIRGFFNENVVVPILEENQAILRQGHIFDMPSDFVEKGYLEDSHRKEIEMDRPVFDKFMRRSGQQARTKGVVQGFVQDKNTGKVYAVFVQSKSYYKRTQDPDTGELSGEGAVVPASETFTLENPFGDIIELDANPLTEDHPDYTLLTYRDPKRQRWTKGRDIAKQLWNTEISNGLPDPIRDAFEAQGIEFPDDAKFIHSKKANINEWEVRVNGREIYRIRQIVPVAEKTVETAFGSYTEYSQPHPAYHAFLDKLLVYKAGEVRDPIFTYRRNVPHKIWTPMENYFPHIINWNEMSVDPNDKTKFEKFVEYAQEVADANGVDLDLAKAILNDHIAESKTRRYGYLEQDRQFVLPNYKRNYFQVWEQYLTRAAHRMQTIKEFGQMNDLLEAKLSEFLNADDAIAEMSDTERAVLKLRFFAGYRDFENGGRGPQYPFREDTGKLVEMDPRSIDFGAMSPAEWQALVDDELLTVTNDGNYQMTPASVFYFENPPFLSGAIAKAVEQQKIAADVIIGQLGWSQGDIFDSIFSDATRQVRNWTGFVYLGRAWASNIVQPVNAAILTNMRAFLKSYIQLMTNPKHREYAKEVGAVAIDVMHDYGGEAQFGNRLLRQMLGATPHYQVGKTKMQSFSPLKKHLEDDGIRTIAWTPFFAVEKMNRTVAALMARSYAAQQIRTMLRHPKRAQTAKKRLISQPGAYGLSDKLDAALSVPNLTPKDIDTVESLTEKEVRAQAPHLFPVYDFFAEYSKEMADFTQHRVESMDRSKLLRDNPMMLMLFQLQSFNIAQTKYIKDTFKREWEIMHEVLKERQPLKFLKNKKAAAALGSLALIPRMLTWSGFYGIQGVILGAIARARVPSEDELTFMTAVAKAGMLTMLGEQMTQIYHWNRGAEEVLLGPALGIGADVLGDAFMALRKGEPGRAFRTPARLTRPPLAGPSVQQLINWAGEGDVMPPKPVKSGRRRAPQRQTLRRRQLR